MKIGELGSTLSEMSTGGSSMMSRSFCVLADWIRSDSPAEELDSTTTKKVTWTL